MGLVFPPLSDIILAGGPLRDAGSASGLLSTAQQLGGAVADVPASIHGQVVAGFGACFVDRAKAKDPTVVPSSCQQAEAGPAGGSSSQADQRIGRVVEPAAAEAVRLNFSRSTERAMRWEAGAFLLAFLLTFLLPPKASSHQHDS